MLPFSNIYAVSAITGLNALGQTKPFCLSRESNWNAFVCYVLWLSKYTDWFIRLNYVRY